MFLLCCYSIAALMILNLWVVLLCRLMVPVRIFLLYSFILLYINIEFLILIHVVGNDVERTKLSDANVKLRKMGPASSTAVQTLGISRQVMSNSTITSINSQRLFFPMLVYSCS